MFVAYAYNDLYEEDLETLEEARKKCIQYLECAGDDAREHFIFEVKDEVVVKSWEHFDFNMLNEVNDYVGQNINDLQ